MVYRSNTKQVEVAPPVASPYGILSPAAHVKVVSTDEWLGGFFSQVYDAKAEYSLSTMLYGDNNTHIILEDDRESQHFLEYEPFMIRASVFGSTMGAKPDFYEQSARDSLEAIQQKAIEEEFWSGFVTQNNRNLAGSNPIDVTPTPGTGVRPKHAQALLEGAVGSQTTGYQATLHFPRTVASVLKLKDREGVLSTTIGSRMIAGSGYNRIGPNGQVSTGSQYWAYATGPVTVLIGDSAVNLVDFPQSVNSPRNTVEYIAEKPAAIVTSTKDTFAVLVDIGLDYA